MHEPGAERPLEFKDCHIGFVIFGILIILAGCGLALLIPLMLLGQMLSGRVSGTESIPLRLMLPGMFMYLGTALAFIWLGIGSIMCRRWARALLLVISWMWLIWGTVGLAGTALMLPQLMTLSHPAGGGQELPESMRTAVAFFALGVNAVIFVFCPGVLVFFYQNRHVKATCETRDPVRRWTDACPLPVLAMTIALAMGAAFTPLIMVFYNSIFPFFGVYICGLPGSIALLLLTVVNGFGAYFCYKLKPAGWWITLLGMGTWMLSGIITFARTGMVQAYEMMGYPQSQITLMKQMGISQNPAMWVLMLVAWIPMLGFIIYTKKYFKN